MLIYEYYNAELLQNTALKIADTVGLLTPPAGQAFGVLSALTNLETVSSTLIENYSAVQVHTLGVSVPTEDAVQAYVQDIIEHDVPSIDKIIVKSATIPTASANLVGAVYQYVGQTDGTYEHGYIYECVAETTTETLIMFDPVGTGKLGFDYQNHSVYELFDRIAALTTPTFDPQDVVSGSFRLDKVNELWYISGYDANGNALFTDFTVEATGGEYCLDGYGYIYTFPFPDDYENGHTENFTIVQDQQSVYSWERIDVQPNSEAEIAELQAEVAEIQSVIPAQASASNQLADKAFVQTGLDSKQDNLTATDGLTLNNNVISGKTLQDDIADINTLIPNQATAQNQLADKAFVNSSIETNTATFRGTYNTLAELEAQPADNNDYGFVVSTDAAGNTVYNRYKYDGTTWVFEYALNNSSFTANQWAAINSNATSAKIAQIGTNATNLANHIADTANPHQVTKAQVGLSNVDNTTDADKPVSTATQSALDAKANNTNRVNGAALSNSASGFFGTSDTAAATVEKVVSIPSITTLDTGTIIMVQPSVTSTVANSTLKLNDFPAYPMRYNNAAITTSTDSTVWSANFPSIWVFDGTYWVFAGHGLDSNTTYAINYSFDAGQYTAGSGTYAVTRYSILAQKADGTWEKITATNANYSTGTSKSVNTSGFILNQLRYYATTASVAGGSKITSNVVYEKAASVDMRYSTNCGGTITWALGDYIYLVGTIGADGLFYLDPTTWWSNALPTTNDGKLYIRLGLVLAEVGYTMSFFDDRPIFYHDGTGIKEYKVADNKQDVISDLATIRSGASAGATAVQPGDLATVATTGSYNDLSNKPTIPAAQVNSDWNATGGVAQILNKPTLGTMAAESASDYTKTSGFATVATSGSYNDLLNKPTIPAAQVNADWGANSGVAQILNKPTLGTAASANATDFATAAQGALADTAVQPADLATVATSGSYTDLSNTPTIPTVNNPTITFTQGGVTKGSLTLNQANGDTIALDAGGGGSGSAQSVGNVFWTMRTDNELNGAVECNGATYDTDDFTGSGSIGTLLAAGRVPYVSLAQYATLLASQGSCGVFGWDGGSTTEFRVPSLNDIFIETGTAAQIGDYIAPGLPNITSGAVIHTWSGNNTGTWTSGAISAEAGNGVGLGGANSYSHTRPGWLDASNSNSAYGNSDTVQPNTVRYRAMVQLATGATDEALETCTGVLADVAELKYDYLVDFQAPTAANNYTWYRKYKSGWVEQGQDRVSASGTVTVSFPVAMASSNYTILKTMETNSGNTGVLYNQVSFYNKTTTSATTTTAGVGFSWLVVGMAAS